MIHDDTPSLPIVTVVAGALIDIDGRLLVAKRPPGKEMAGQWEFPGGKIEPGETPEQALIRELQEELAVRTQTNCLAPVTFASHRYPASHVLVLLFVCRIWQGDARPLLGQSLRWLAINELNSLDLLAATRMMVPVLRDLLA
ncbi:MAG: (deoxy)nucleoside triphosphate pyrophosphohydrolase [Pseudomonadota bacterium]